MTRLIPTRAEFEDRIPVEYRSHAGVGPYYLPVFGRIYSKRLVQCLGAVRRYGGEPDQILDVGCGFGLATAAMALMFPRAIVRGLDLYPPEVLKIAKSLMPASAGVDFVTGSVEQAPFEDGTFDLITALDVLEHVGHPELALEEISRLLAPGGTIVASVPIESPILRVVRYIYLRGGERGEIHPHWEGTFRRLKDFELAWDRHFTGVARFNAPFPFAPRVTNYDVIYVGRKRSRAPRSDR